MKFGKIGRIILYYITKYFALFSISMIFNNDYKILNLKGNIHSVEELFFFLWIILFYPIVNIIVFTIPIYLSFKYIKNFVIFLLLNFIFMILEVLILKYFTSEKYQFDLETLQLLGLSIICFLLILRKDLRTILKNK